MTKTMLLATITVATILTATIAGTMFTTNAEADLILKTPFVATETINLNGKLKSGDFKLLMDITPFSAITGHVAMKVPCDKKGETSLEILAGVAPKVASIKMEFVKQLSNPGKSCLYHGELKGSITDVALINNGEKKVDFGKGAGHTVTITIAGTDR